MMEKRRLSRWVALALLLSAPLAGWTEPLKVVALNIEWFPGQGRNPTDEDIERHIGETRAELGKMDADIFIGTEICDADAFRDVLAAIPGLELHVISSFTGSEDGAEVWRGQQIAIASRLPAVAGWAEPWLPAMDGLRRGFAFAALENPKTGRLLLVYGLHLKSNRSDSPEEEQRNYDIRDESTRQLIHHMERMDLQFAERGIDGWIVAGDINTNHDGRFLDQVVEMITQAGFHNTWINTPPEARHTWKGRIERFEPTTLDYIFLKGLGEPDAELIWISETVSDHNAVMVEMQLPEPASDPVED